MRLVSLHVVVTCLLLAASSASRAQGENASADPTEPAEEAPENGDGAQEQDTNSAEAQSDSSETRSIGAPLSPYGFSGPELGRIALSLGGGWPAGWLEIDYGATERLGVGLQVGYLFGVPTGGITTASGVQIGLQTRLGLIRRSNLELTLDVSAGFVVAFDHRLAVVADDIEDEEDQGIIPSDQLRPLGNQLSVGVTISWLLSQNINLKFGFQIPSTLVLVMADRPYEDTWELALPFAARAGIVWRALRWLGLFALIDVGPSLTVTPSEWTSDGYGHEVGVDVYLRASAGVTFAPWP